MKCPKCQSPIIEHAGIDFCYCSKVECGWQGTISQQEEMDRLLGLLREIEEHPHNDGYAYGESHFRYKDGYPNYEFMEGAKEGHHCCAEIARKAHQ